MMSTDSQPNLARRAPSSLVFASSTCAVSRTMSLPSACFADSAVLRARRRTFFCRPKAWLRTTGPKIRARPRNCGERRVPWRARPPPFCLNGFLVVPWMSLMPLALWVPARRLASCQLTMRARMSGRTATPKTSSLSSISPASWLSRFFIVSFMLLGLRPSGRFRRRCGRRRRTPNRRWERQVAWRFALHRILDQNITAVAARNRAAHHDQPALDIGGDDAQILRCHPNVAEMAGHLLALERLAGILALAGRAQAAMRHRYAVP